MVIFPQDFEFQPFMADIQKQTIVVADNDPDFLEWASKHLEADSVKILTTTSSEEALKLFVEGGGDLLVAEFNLQSMDGVTLLKKVRLSQPNAMVILNGVGELDQCCD